MSTGGFNIIVAPCIMYFNNFFLNKYERTFNDLEMIFLNYPDPDSRSPPRRGGKRGGGPKFIVSRGGAGSGCEKISKIGAGRGRVCEKNSEIGVGRVGELKKLENRGGAGRGHKSFSK